MVLSPLPNRFFLVNLSTSGAASVAVFFTVFFDYLRRFTCVSCLHHLHRFSPRVFCVLVFGGGGFRRLVLEVVTVVSLLLNCDFRSPCLQFVLGRA